MKPLTQIWRMLAAPASEGRDSEPGALRPTRLRINPSAALIPLNFAGANLHGRHGRLGQKQIFVSVPSLRINYLRGEKMGHCPKRPKWTDGFEQLRAPLNTFSLAPRKSHLRRHPRIRIPHLMFEQHGYFPSKSKAKT